MNETFVVSRGSGEHTDQRHADDSSMLGASFDISHRDVDTTDPIQEQEYRNSKQMIFSRLLKCKND